MRCYILKVKAIHDKIPIRKGVLNLELLQLKYFCNAAETQNFSKTAKKFIVPTSNISQSIKRLEAELDTPLFDRTSNTVRLNGAGLLFYKKARSALNLLESAQNALKSNPPAKEIKINIRIHRRIVMGIIEQFRVKHPQIHFITTHTVDESNADFDIIITDEALECGYLKAQAAEEDIVLAYCSTTFPLDAEFSAATLQDLPFVTMRSGNSMYEITKMICNQLGFEPNIVLQSEDPFYIRKCIELGLGIAIVPELSWRGQLSETVSLKKIGEFKRKIFVYKKHGTNEVLDEFYDMLMEAFWG